MRTKSLLILLFLLISLDVVSAATPPIVYVARDGTGDYNCDGTSDQVQINEAILFAYNNRASGYTTVYLREGSYIIDSQVYMCNNIILTGDSTAEIKLMDDCDWAKTYTGTLSYSSSGSQTLPMIMARSGHNTGFTFRGFTIDGNSQGNTDVAFGQGYYTMMQFYQCTHVTVDQMTLEYGKGDGLVFRTGDYATMTNCNVNKLGHDAMYNLYSDYIVFENNSVFTRTNSACRISGGAHVSIQNNHIYSGTITSADGGGSSTGPGIEIDIDGSEYCYDVEIAYNVINTLRGSGIWITCENGNARDIWIHNNIIYDVGRYTYDNGYSTAGITIFQTNNTIIENNVFEDAGLAAVRYSKGGDAYTGDADLYHTIFRNNIVINTNDQLPTTSGGSTYITAIPIMNTLSTYSRIHAYNNDFYNNANNLAYKSNVATDSNNLAVDPQFVDSSAHNYHLKSTAGHYNNGAWVTDSTSSPLIDMGLISSPYVNEPEPNGNRINIGAYGNTDEASKSPSETYVPPEDPVNPEPDPIVITIEDPVDNRLRSLAPTTVYSSTTYIDVGNIASTGSTVRDVIWYDLDGYNSSSQITSAKLKLYWYYQSTRTNDTIVEIYRPATSWSTSTATWNNANTWYDANGVLGGSTPYDSITFPQNTAPTNSYYEFDVTELVSSYVDGTYTNTGFFIKTRNENNDYIAFYSLDYTDSSKIPVLDISATTVDISSYTPLTNPTIDLGNSTTFTVDLTSYGTVEWSVDNVVKEYDTNIDYASYTFTPSAARSYIVKAETNTDSKSWTVLVESEETPSTPSNTTTTGTSNVYVSTTGSDTTGDGSISTPYATISKALSSSEAPTILVKGGTYALTTSVNRDDIIIKSYDGIATFNHVDDSGIAFTVTGRTNVTLQDLIITNYQYGIYGNTALTNLKLENCTITSNSQEGLWLNNINANQIYIYNSTFGDNAVRGAHFSNHDSIASGKIIQNIDLIGNTFYDSPTSLLDFRSNVTNVYASGNTYYYNTGETQGVGVYIHNENLETFEFDGENFTGCARPLEILNGQSIIIRNSQWNTVKNAEGSPVIVNGESYPVTYTGRALLFGGASPSNEGVSYTGYNNIFNGVTQTLFRTYSESSGTPVYIREYNATLVDVDTIFSPSSCIENIAVTIQHNSPTKTFEFTNGESLTWKWYVDGSLVETDSNTFIPSRSQYNMAVGTNVSAICTDNDDNLRITWIMGSGEAVNGIIYTRYPTTPNPKELKDNTVNFNLTLNDEAQTLWYVNNVLIETDNSTTPSLAYFPTVSGTHTIRAVTAEDTYTWTLTVENPKQKFYVGVLTRIGDSLTWGERKPKYEDTIAEGFNIIFG